jgi:hypothetical protein
MSLERRQRNKERFKQLDEPTDEDILASQTTPYQVSSQMADEVQQDPHKRLGVIGLRHCHRHYHACNRELIQEMRH